MRKRRYSPYGLASNDFEADGVGFDGFPLGTVGFELLFCLSHCVTAEVVGIRRYLMVLVGIADSGEEGKYLAATLT